MTLTLSTTRNVEDVRALRHAVFVDEQGFSEEDEFDARDHDALHLMLSDGETLVGCARVFSADGEGRIGRICVARSHRGRGLGARLVEAGMSELRARGETRVALGAQVRAQGFYEALGFLPRGEVYDDGGVPHQMMERALASK
ncbi:GNAT family N-acetyltransferase [Litorisediminicola beolgyonensis]|uniref:GNAT family N-acetyltransferase n=1 Tax=Litorisediminicola beolgyonensis TaxID=1173614 RepID=A0ABW3ZJ48_9RHOB